jgi:hypothetical protein
MVSICAVFPLDFPLLSAFFQSLLLTDNSLNYNELRNAKGGESGADAVKKVGNEKNAFSWNLRGGAPTQEQTGSRK